MALVRQILGAVEQMQTQLQALHGVTAAREPGHRGVSCLDDVVPDLRLPYPALTTVMQGQTTPLPLASSGLTIVLTHLFGNAAQHAATGITLIATATALTVTDNGTGITPGNRARIFDAFFTTRRDTGGTGMGLTIVENLLQAHGAAIQPAPTPQGTRFQITFPPPSI